MYVCGRAERRLGGIGGKGEVEEVGRPKSNI